MGLIPFCALSKVKGKVIKMSTKIDFIIEQGIGYITFFDEKKGCPCTLDYEVLEALNAIIDEVYSGKKEDIRALVIQSRSEKYFNLGANIKVLQKITPESIINWVLKGHRIFNKFAELSIPVISKVEGYALGGGMELAIATDMIIASEEARFGQPEASLGVIPGWGSTLRLQKLIGTVRAKELFFTGRIITANEAYRMGLVCRVIKKEDMNNTFKETLEAIIKNSNLSISLIKKIMRKSITQELQVNVLEEAVASSLCMQSPDTIKRLNNFFNSKEMQ